MLSCSLLPRLSLNSHNPEFSSLPESREESPNTSSGSSEDVSMEADTGEDSETKRANRTLEMVSLWICHQIRLSSASLDPELFKLLPYLCQFIGTETDQDVSQACLQVSFQTCRETIVSQDVGGDFSRLSLTDETR